MIIGDKGLPLRPIVLIDSLKTGTGKVELRKRIIKGIRLQKDRAILLVAQSIRGILESWTMIPTSNLKYINKQRRGKLIWAR